VVTAPGGSRFEPGLIEIRAGEVTEFELVNRDAQEHTFVISELAVVMLAGAEQTVRSSTLIDRKNRGRFAFFCSIGGHRAAGMEGTIEVR
jgi:nitrite reductase (NO-forming)